MCPPSRWNHCSLQSETRRHVCYFLVHVDKHQHGDGASHWLMQVSIPDKNADHELNEQRRKERRAQSEERWEEERLNNARYKARNKIYFFWSSTRGKWSERWGNENSVIQLGAAKRLPEFKCDYGRAQFAMLKRADPSGWSGHLACKKEGWRKCS